MKIYTPELVQIYEKTRERIYIYVAKMCFNQTTIDGTVENTFHSIASN